MSGFIERVRFSKRQLSNPLLTEEERKNIRRKTFPNYIVKLRRDIRFILRSREELINVNMSIHHDIKTEQAQIFKNQSRIDKLQENYEITSKLITELNESLDSNGELAIMLLETFEEVGGTLHDFCQLIGANVKDVEKHCKHLESYDEKINVQSSLFVDLIWVCQAELPLTGKNVDSVWTQESQTPLFDAIFEHIRAEMKRNKKFKKAINQCFYKCFPELRDCMIKIEHDGTITPNRPH